jgi:hypothetical protein
MNVEIWVTTTVLDWAAAAAAFILLYAWAFRNSQNERLPPGPPADPLIGHLRRIPLSAQEKTFAAWGNMVSAHPLPLFFLTNPVGDVIYLHCLGKKLLVLNSVEATQDLLDKRGATYSNRPRFVLFGEM